MSAVAAQIASLNGVPASRVSTSLVASPANPSYQAVQVIIAGSEPLFLAPILGADPSVTIRALATTQIGQGTTACIIALSPAASGVTLSGGTSIRAPGCTVASNSSVNVPCGTSITATTVAYDSASPPSQPCAGIAGQIVKSRTNDPLAGTSGVIAATQRIAVVAQQTPPAAVLAGSGPDTSFGYTSGPLSVGGGCTATTSPAYSGQWTVSCPAGGVYNFGAMATAVKFTLVTTGTSSTLTTFTFSGPVRLSGTNVFPAAKYVFASGVLANGGSSTRFDGGSTFIFGNGTAYCSTGYFSICNKSTITFNGPAHFVVSAGIQNTGGSSLMLGFGTGITANSISIGPSSSGDAINLEGGSKTYFGDATGASSVFQVTGDINQAGGGSCLIVSAAEHHDIEGSISASGAIIFGSGAYTIDGYMALGGSGGGYSPCQGATTSVYAKDVTFVMSGKKTPASGSCANIIYCVSAGYSDIVISSPTTGTYANLAVIGPTSPSVTAGASIIQGGSNGQIAGAFYFPYGPITLDGGAGIVGGTRCLQLIGSSLTLTAGSIVGSSCVAGSSSGTKPVLVQ